MKRACFLALLFFALLGAESAPAQTAQEVAPLVIGETFTLQSAVLAEKRRINVYFPPGFSPASEEQLPVLYMPDGGMGEDFLHIAGLVQISVINGTMRPFLLVGIENTERRRDLTGPTVIEEDKKIAPRVGGSTAFRKFIRSELMPEIRKRYRTQAETAIVGESLAGLFVVETFLLEPDLFATFIAVDPSLWWNNEQLVKDTGDLVAKKSLSGKTLFLATSDQGEIGEATRRLASVLEAHPSSGLRWIYEPMPQETHRTIYHPAALKAFRAVFNPPPTDAR